jgi:excinuclease ABC subunit B
LTPGGWSFSLLNVAFDLNSDYAPAGDQPQAIAKLTDGLLAGAKHQVLRGVTGSGKTFTVANVVKNQDKPTQHY